MASSKQPRKDKDGPELPELAAEREIEQELQKRPKGMPALSLIKTEMAHLGCPESDAEYVFDLWLANGFKTKTGQIKDWRAAIRVYFRNNWLPSQKQGGKGRTSQEEALKRIRRAKKGG
jgi:hypothetical protein